MIGNLDVPVIAGEKRTACARTLLFEGDSQ